MKVPACFNAPTLAVAMMILLVAGCGRHDVKVYKVDSKDPVVTPPPAVAPGGMPATMPGDIPVPGNSALPKLKYTLPAGWKEKALTQMRVASFDVSENGKTADVSVIPLSGNAGGDAANINRWRGQVGLGQFDEDALKKSAEAAMVGDNPAALYDIAGTSPGSGDAQRIVGVILHGDDESWYFKMMGDAELVAKQKDNFKAFLKSVDFGAGAAPATMDLNQLPPSHPQIPGMNSGTAPSADSADKPTWVVPSDWQPGELAQFLVARFVVKGSGDATAAVNVSQLSGDGGGLLANVNRWRGQLGEKQISEADAANLPTIDAAGVKAILADITGTDAKTGKPARLVGAVVPQNGQTWFYKLMGDPDVVGAQKDAFIKFVQSAKYPPAK